MDPHEHFFNTAEIPIYSNTNPDKAPTVIKIFRSDVSGRCPETLKFNQWFINTVDKTLFIGDTRGRPQEYKLIQASLVK